MVSKFSQKLILIAFVGVSTWLIYRAYMSSSSGRCGVLRENFDSRQDTCKQLSDIYDKFQIYRDSIQNDIVEVLSTAENVSLYSDCNANDIDSCKTTCE
jgi:hypothetical protein